MEDIRSRSRKLLTASLATNTHVAYRNAITAFNKFRLTHNLGTHWPAAVIQVQYFISSCFEKGFSPATICTYCSGISFFHKINSLQDPTSTFIIQKMLEGCRRSRKQNDIRAPISKDLLKSICSKLSETCSSHYEISLFKAAFTLAYFGLLRISELVYTGPLHTDRPLQLCDISYDLQNKILLIQIRKSKTDQSGKAIKLKIYPEEKGNICCVQSVLEYIKARPRSKGYLFCHLNTQPLTRYQFSSILAKCISKLGLSTVFFKTHSFRIGRATDLAINGLSADTIKKLGRWSSNTFYKYIRK